MTETTMGNMFVGCGILLVLSLLTCAKLTVNGGTAIDVTKLLVFTDFSFVNAAYFKVFYQVLLKGIAILGYVLQYHQRIVAMGSAILAELSRLKMRQLILYCWIFLTEVNLSDRSDMVLSFRTYLGNVRGIESKTSNVICCSEDRKIGSVFVTWASARPSIC